MDRAGQHLGAADSRILELRGASAEPTTIRAKALVFADPLSQQLLHYLEQVSPSEAPVLIIGETGTGKELIARHIHHLSRRRGPFVAVNCGAISEQLADSELFGHEQGAYTGANTRREGWFEAANGGTLFLDEIGDLPLSLQVKLLRVLQECEVTRLGSRRAIPIDIRLVAATNVDLNDAVAAQRFRLDLFYRLNIAQLRVPPLRERISDIMPLAQHFLGVYAQKLNTTRPSFSAAAITALEAYAWPGNIRELENVIHFALLVCSDLEVRPEHLKLNSISHPSNGSATATAAPPRERISSAVQELLSLNTPDLYNTLEHQIVDEAFRYSGYNQVRAAAVLGISRNVLRTLLKKYGYLSERQTEITNS
ncbi:DNA-binding transcriptional response regulator, NtrC family, contains REC, AAA-type ATPase, and a Fis-type DNA-binding domains [Hydrocarboniphaga daqingensis]|uniref:DNA-binding transcriptional response regulator, NtrC family, contains REC, AAA-type ATPase, and a Fis-type DNA-binding domains n=1 Tax=Hydrocarboniphaga daqingensis TaxID=490188 RepID=A0A1M5KMJ9_9GAMM|nr:sigma-54 dependent transcriptional regulator [Hydrocarboniphaga daqingensis]SHG53920.1 DNA-binding transcriptional response regulator, NtrC family, contains REC, AAA-type ATPase, and a Fis-type DNA-binding domains [Hydrocarboniphaga daqingensis]